MCCAHLIDVGMNRQSDLTVRCLDLAVGGAPRNAQDGVVVSHRAEYSCHRAALRTSSELERERKWSSINKLAFWYRGSTGSGKCAPTPEAHHQHGERRVEDCLCSHEEASIEESNSKVKR